MYRIVSAIGLSAVAAGAAAGISITASAQSDVAGHVYVNDNTAGANTIAAFDRHSDGSLTPIPGSPFAAGGAGLGSIVGSRAPFR